MMSTYFLRPFRSAAMPVVSRFGFFTLMIRLLMISVIGAATNAAVPMGWAAQFGNRAGVGSEEPVKFSAEFKINPDSPGSRLGSLNVIATIEDGWHIYSVTQKPGGPTPSRIDVVKTEKFSVDGDFQPDVPAEVNETDLFDVPVEEHHGAVVWSAPIQLAKGVDPKDLRIEVTYRGLRCSDAGQCFPIRPVTILAAYGGEDKTLIVPEPPQAKPVKTIEPKQIEPKQIPKETKGSSTDEKSTAYESDSPEKIAEMLLLYQPDEKISIRDQKVTTIWVALFGAFVGGMLLNLMPCVFPVLGLKVMGFVEQAGSDPKKIRIHGIVFTLGLVASMWVLASVILILKNIYKIEINWGTQMGNPYFVVSIIVLLFLLGLNMAGVFEIGTSLTRVGGSTQGKKGYSSSFLSGVLTTLVATPCSGPFLGVAMAYTFAQPAAIAMFLFTIFALGIAFPYIVLAFFPAMINRLPRPGAWMHTFKVTMAFALFATVAFFMQTFGAQTGADGLSWLVMALVVLGLAAFFYGTWSPAYVKPFKRLAFGFLMPSAIALLAGWMCFDAAQYRQVSINVQQVGKVPWQKWHPGKIEYLLKNDPRIIWVDYTANWCVTCQSNKKWIFSDPRVLKRIEELNVQLVKVDDTLIEDRIRVDLARTGRVTIPVNLFYPPNYPAAPAILLEAVITPGQALKALDEMEKIQKQWQAKKG